MLMERPFITRIQLPASMQKVGPSLIQEENVSNDWACLLITSAGTHPSGTNVTRGNILNGKAPPKSYKNNDLSPMIKSLLLGLTVPLSILQAFAVQTSRLRDVVEHASLVGVADPTGSLPAGHIFVTGLTELCCRQSLEHLFVTRFPCTEPGDGRLLPMVTTKPDEMRSSDWDWLKGLSFGLIVFANPLPGCAPMPTTIAGGDLDGDLYFVTWSEVILSNLDTTNMNHGHVPVPEPSGEVEIGYLQSDWLKAAQNQMADLFSVLNCQSLIGKLYKEWNTRVLVSDYGSDALAFGKAFKQAIDVGKHGGPVSLAPHLWQEIPEHLHKFLSPE